MSECQYDSSKQFSRSSFQFYSWGALLIVQWSKTIQFRERIVQIPLPVIPCSPLCPVPSVLHALSFTSGSTPNFHAFVYFDIKLLRFYLQVFFSKLRKCLQTLGYNPHDYARHLFHRVDLRRSKPYHYLGLCSHPIRKSIFRDFRY